MAVICFEWLQRPANVIASHLKWSDYRGPSAEDEVLRSLVMEILLTPEAGDLKIDARAV